MDNANGRNSADHTRDDQLGLHISRHDLIAAGANFSVVNLQQGRISYDEDSPSSWWVISQPFLSIIRIYPNAGFSSEFMTFGVNCSYAQARREVADFIEPISQKDGCALRAPWEGQTKNGWPDANWAVRNGLSLDALLYSAAQKADSAAVTQYLRAGADPLAKTFDLDCAARLGIAHRMINCFGRPEWLDSVATDAGETGLFQLARNRELDLIEQAYRMGANPDLRNRRGETVIDLLDDQHRLPIEAVIAEARASRLTAKTHAVGDAAASARRTAGRL